MGLDLIIGFICFGIHLAGMLATVKQKDALTAEHLACWKVIAQSTHVSLAGMMAGTHANQKMKDSATASYCGRQSSMETEKALMSVHMLTMVIHRAERLAGIQVAPKGLTMADSMTV